MNGLTIHFRLRFAVAVTLAALLLLTLGTRASYAQTTAATSEYIVEMQAGYTPTQGRDIVAELGGQVTTPSLPVINGFGATLDEESADELAARPGVAAVTHEHRPRGRRRHERRRALPPGEPEEEGAEAQGQLGLPRLPNPQTAIGAHRHSRSRRRSAPTRRGCAACTAPASAWRSSTPASPATSPTSCPPASRA